MYFLKIHYSQGTWKFPCTSKGTSAEGTWKFPCTSKGTSEKVQEISMYFLKIHYSQGTWKFPCTSKGTSEKEHGNFHLPFENKFESGYMGIFMYLLK